MTASNKKILRIAGTAYSGSTMLDLMLANSKDAFSCGEVHHIFRPSRPEHLAPKCGCGDPACSIWIEVIQNGEKKLWNTLTTKFPNIRIFIDSSKNPAWFSDQQSNDTIRAFSTENILIWKTPLEFAQSMWKRNKFKFWKQAYIKYHTLYFNVATTWNSIRYADLARNPAKKLEALCRSIDIEYFPGKEKYWNKVHHSLFGSHSAKIHLHDKSSDMFASLKRQRTKFKPGFNPEETTEVKRHRHIYYDANNELQGFPVELVKDEARDTMIHAIKSVLQCTEIESTCEPEKLQRLLESIKPSTWWYEKMFVKRKLRYFMNKYSIV